MTKHPAHHGDLPVDLADRIDPRPATAQTVFDGHVWDVTRETFELDGRPITREVVRHPGAVAVVALRGEPGSEQVLLIQQYRHPVGAFDWELPAGLLDQPGEAPHHAAARELLEEVDLIARGWHVLSDVFTTAGASSENVRIYVAHDVELGESDFERVDEEAGMPTGWISLDDALAAVQEGRIHNSLTIIGIQATVLARQSNWAHVRPVDAPWPAHPAYR